MTIDQNFEQVSALFQNYATVIADFYVKLKEGGVSSEHALPMTLSFENALFGRFLYGESAPQEAEDE